MLTNESVVNRAMAVESVTGYDPLLDTRRREVVTARALLAWSLLKEGRTEHEVASAIGWTRPTVHYYREIFTDAEIYGNRPELLLGWEKLKKILDK